MANFPPPDWLTLPEAIDHLNALGFAECGCRGALLRAFKDCRISTRGRCWELFGHDNLTTLGGRPWERCEVDWAASSVRTEYRGEDEISDDGGHITDIEVSRASLERWLTSAGVVGIGHEAEPVQEPEAEAASAPMSEAASARLAERVFGQMRQDGEAGGEDILAERLQEAAREEGKYITRERGRQLAKTLGADIKRRPGRPAKNSAISNPAKK